MAFSMQHHNGHQMCVIDIETTGLDPYMDEIIQICIVALDSNIEPRRDVMPFFIEIAPVNPEAVSPEAMSVNKLDLVRICQRGHDREKAKDLLDNWVNKLKLPYTPSGERKRILPLAQNWVFDSAFIKRWLGPNTFSGIFDGRYRDTQTVSLYLNDRAAVHGEKVPFSKNNLNWLCSKLNVENHKAHDAMSDCLATAEVYRRLLQGALIE